MRRLILATALCGCASMQPPPGGPEDTAPPRIVSMTPDTGAINFSGSEIEIAFDEVIAEPTRMSSRAAAAGLQQFVVVSPDPGRIGVEWHRSRITITARDGFRPNTAYRVTILPGLADLRGHSIGTQHSWRFSTGAVFPPFQLTGTIFDWAAERPAPGGIVEAVFRPSPTDSLVYRAVADSTGKFTISPVEGGEYELRGFIDANNNQRLDLAEKWSGVVRTVVSAAVRTPELLAIQRDTAPPSLAPTNAMEIVDSLTIRLVTTHPFDAVQPLPPTLVRLQRSDSSDIPIAAVLNSTQFAEQQRAAEQAVADSTARATRDSLAATNPARAAIPLIGAATQPGEAKPSQPAPVNVIIIRLAPSSAIKVGEEVRVTIRGLRSIAGVPQTKPATTTARRAK